MSTLSFSDEDEEQLVVPRVVEKYEREPNDTFNTANTIENKDYVYGYINQEKDVDMYKIKFDDYGVARIFLKNIPLKRDYDVIVYNSEKKQINQGLNSSNTNEDICIHVEPNVWYYISVVGITGYSASDEYCLWVSRLPYIAAGYATNYDIDTRNDLTAFENYLGERMGYRVEKYDKPELSDLKQLRGTAVALLSTHGNADSVRFQDISGKEIYKCGIYSGDSQKKGGISYVGLRDLNLNSCTLAIFAACNTAGTSADFSRNIANRAVTVSRARSSLGWAVPIYNPDMFYWLSMFFNELLQPSTTVEDAVKAVNMKYEGRWEDSVYECKYYGDSDATLSLPTITLPYNINVDDIEKDAAEIKYIKEDIFIDIEKRNFSELENYLERNIAGFSADKFILNQDRIHDVGENDYFLYYEFFENGFKSPYFVAVSCEDGSPEMFSFNFTKENIDQFTQAQRIGINEISEDTIEKAKYWALQEINDDSYVVKEQTVTPRVDDKGNHSLYVRTTVQYVLDGDCFDKLYVYTYPLD